MSFDLDDEENKATRIANGASKESGDKNIDIEVGEYVRTDKGHIFKIDKEKKNLQMAKFLNAEYGNIVKHSKELIDLVEVRRYSK